LIVAGHIEDRWYRPKRDPVTKKVIVDEKGKVVKERSPLYGKGLRYKVHYYDADSQEHAKSFPDKQLTKAQDFLTKQQHDVLAGVFVDPAGGKLTFKEYAATVLMGRSQDPSTVRTVTSNLANQVYPFLGGRQLAAIDADVIRKWLGWMDGQERPPSNTYRKQLYDMVSSILEAAVSDKKIRSNPCRDKSISRPSAGGYKVRPWSEAKMRKIKMAMPPRRQISVTIGGGIGLRQGEILAFSMDNVDREKMVYHCTRQLVRIKGQFMWKLPKGHKTREIPLGRGVLEELDDYAENFEPVAFTLPWGERDGKKFETVSVLMTNDKGELDSGVTFNDTVWRPAFDVAGVTYEPDRSDGMHALRHLFASSMLARGVSIKELAAFLGHASEAFTLKTYVHLMPNSYDRARLAVDEMFRPRKSTPEQSGEGNTA
jgi:integrase